MNIKTFLLASAAALVAINGTQAADAIVAAEPEPMEYVRVCDAFGTGYFYIPGTETCLRVGGEIRLQADGRSDNDLSGDDAGYRTNTRAEVFFDARTDTELGTLRSLITMRAETNTDEAFALNETYIELGGFRVGYFYNYFDTGLPGETVMHDDRPFNNGGEGADTLNNSIRYTYEGGVVSVYGQVDAFDSQDGWKTDADGNADEIGINGVIAGKIGDLTLDFFAGYDFDNENAALASTLNADLGAGSLGIFAAYAFGQNRYYDASEWTIGAEYAFAVSDKFTVAPGAQYFDNIVLGSDGEFDGGDAWRVGVTADYSITTDLAAKVTVNYTEVDTGSDSADVWDGFLRLQRDF